MTESERLHKLGVQNTQNYVETTWGEGRKLLTSHKICYVKLGDSFQPRCPLPVFPENLFVSGDIRPGIIHTTQVQASPEATANMALLNRGGNRWSESQSPFYGH